ncbi:MULTISPECIES: ROK family transcriptional regulator [Peribacillus]|uniref:ROK family protein n=1 Tax=Peribacillus simplex TaxID=1478 RepID=A0A109N339_9BACI|nr:ROK family transcriptional regulator [Peribacillus simplex]KWW22654.1 ROK family protein [Peribacillus simplex]
MITGDAAYIKKINRALIIKEIIKEGMISRADLSKATDLTRATISAQVADLLEEDLIVETQLEYTGVGRKPIMLSLNGQAGYALGIDIDYGRISFTLSDLLGNCITSSIQELSTTDYSEVLQVVIETIKQLKATYADSRYGIVGVVIAIHGLVGKDEIIHYVPRFKWHDIDLKSAIETECQMDVHLENNANLSAFAERIFVHHEANNLLSTTFHSGIGLGMMMKDDFFRGHDGFAGEIGHMIVVPDGKPCNCGNKGCWEKYASESSIFEYLSEEKKIPNLTYEHIQRMIDEGDAAVHKVMDRFIYYISIGINNLINMYNPDVLVLDSELLRIYPDSITKISNNLTSSISHYREITLSAMGKKSCVMGACALAIKKFLDVPILNLSYEISQQNKS